MPTDCPDERLRDFVRRKRMWIYQQLARKAATSAAVRPKEFVDGEGFAYLGRSYRLRLIPPGESTDRARPWLAHKVKDYSARMEDDPAACAHRRIRRGA